MMPSPFSPAMFAIGSAALIAGATAEAWIAHQVPRYRTMLSVALFGMIALAVLTGVRTETLFGAAVMGNEAEIIGALFGTITRQLAIIAFLCGAQTIIVQQDTQRRLFGLAMAGIIGVPTLTSISFGIGMSAMTAGV